MADELGKLAVELDKPEPEARRVRRFFRRVQEVAPPVASALSSAPGLVEMLAGEEK